MRDPDLERRLGHPLDRLRRDPRNRCCRCFDPHAPNARTGIDPRPGRWPVPAWGGSTPEVRDTALLAVVRHNRLNDWDGINDWDGKRRNHSRLHRSAANHGLPRRRQRDRARGRRGPARRSSPTSRSSAPPPTTTSWSRAPTAPTPQVVVTDIRMPPDLPAGGDRRREGDPQAPPGHRRGGPLPVRRPRVRRSSLLADGAAGYAYLLKDRVAEGDQLARAVREVATGGSVLDPKIVEALVQPVTRRRRAHRRRGGAAAPGGGGSADQGHRGARRAPRPPRWPTRSRSSFLKLVARARAPATAGVASAAPDAARGDRRPRGAGRDAEPAPARPASPTKVRSEGRAHRRDRGARWSPC